MAEKDYYPIVRKWLEKKGYYCGGRIYDRNGNLKYYQDKGPKQLRIDVAGIRNIGNRVSNEIEIVAIEVRDKPNVSVRDVQDAHAYSQYAHKCYLATTSNIKIQDKRFAENLGIGLLQIHGKQVKEVLSPQIKKPNVSMMMRFLKVLDIAKCPICGTFFEIFVRKTENYESFHRFIRPKYFNIAHDDPDMDIFDSKELKKLKAAYKNYGYICRICLEEFFPKKL